MQVHRHFRCLRCTGLFTPSIFTMICGICNENEAKYRCPRCNVHYCSLVCFKGPNHVHLEAEKPTQADKPETDANQKSSIKNESANNSNLFGRIASDPQIQSMLKYKSLQFHLSVISKILDDPQISGEQTTAGRREVANAKLTQLRGGGSEENELVEDFAARVLEIMEENKREK